MFLVATPRFQRSVLERRPLPPTADARQALANRIEKDRLYGERVVSLAEARGFATVPVDGTRPVSGRRAAGRTARCCDVVSLSLSGYGATGLVRAPGH